MPMTKDEDMIVRLGTEMVKMIHELKGKTGDDIGYSRRMFTYPGGYVELLMVTDSSLADLMETAAKANFDVHTVYPRPN